MEKGFLIVEEAEEALSHVVKSFKFYRNENSCLNELMEEIESTLRRRCRQNSGELNGTIKKRKFDPSFEESTISKSRQNSTNSHAVEGCQCSVKNSANNTLVPDEERTVEEKVFGISLLLETIFGHLTSVDLKSCRCVNLAWNSAASMILLKREAFKISFSLHDPLSDAYFYLSSKEEKYHQITKLSAVTELIEKSIKSGCTFPCSNFVFINGNLTNVQLQAFLSKCGQVVKRLEIDISDYSESDFGQYEMLKLFRKLLTQDLPNVEEFILENLPKLWSDEDDMSQLFPEPSNAACSNNNNRLAKLKSISFLNCKSVPEKIFKDLITAPRNLQCITLSLGCDALVTILIEARKISLLTSLEIILDEDNVELFNSISRQDLKLKHLSMDLDNSDDELCSIAKPVILRCLKTCSGTLEKLVTAPFGPFFGTEIPVMPHLKTLRITNDEFPFGIVFPEDLQLSKVFPCLESYESQVDYFIRDEDGDDFILEWDECFGASNTDKLPSVKQLNFSRGPPISWIPNFSEMFENLTALRVSFFDNFPDAARLFWKLRVLEKLEFNIEVDVNDAINKYPAIDMGFTGFSAETCLQLYKNSREVDVSTLDGLREFPSLLDAKYLRKLHVMIFDSSMEARVSDTFACISHVAGLFAFQMCPELEVTVSFRVQSGQDGNERVLKNALSPILPYICALQKSSRDPYDSESLDWQ